MCRSLLGALPPCPDQASDHATFRALASLDQETKKLPPRLPPDPDVPWVFSKDATCTGTHENLIQLTMGIFVQREAATGSLNEDIDSGRRTFKLNADRACKCAIKRLGSADDNIHAGPLSDSRTSSATLKFRSSARAPLAAAHRA